MDGCETQEAVEPAFEVGEVGSQSAVGQFLAPAPKGAGALEEAFQAGRENAVAAFRRHIGRRE